jgi:hypothetical protein
LCGAGTREIAENKIAFAVVQALGNKREIMSEIFSSSARTFRFYFFREE